MVSWVWEQGREPCPSRFRCRGSRDIGNGERRRRCEAGAPCTAAAATLPNLQASTGGKGWRRRRGDGGGDALACPSSQF